MKTCLLAAIALTSILHASAAPDILFIVSDDQGWRDIGYRNPAIQTPNLDKLAGEGVKLEHHYVFPTCSPTRCAIMSGRNPADFNILGPIGGTSSQVMPREIPNLATVLKSKGYHTAISGKWHLSLQIENGPKRYGFDSTYGYLHGQIDPYLHDYKQGDRTWHRNDVLVDEQGHATDLIAAEAVRVLGEKRAGPLFLYVAFSVPHTPLSEEPRWLDRYQSVFKEETRRLVAASITHMDDAIGRIITALDKSGRRENTLIVFTGDNGGLAKADGGNYDGRYKDQNGRHSDNGPLRSWKSDVYEGGILAPTFVNWPAKLKPRTETAVISALDWLPTFAAMTDFTVSAEMKLGGQNIWPVLTGEVQGAARTLFWRTSKLMAVRDGDWKLITAKDADDQLFNEKTDPNEKDDVAAANAGITARLSQKLKRWKDDLPEMKKDK